MLIIEHFSNEKSNDAIAVASRHDWLKNLAPVFQPMRSKI